ncbi:hypothetical protein COCVIDRAFT_101953 [Bipolaris victoriae FI3]|uniref:Uncharacterized protein n=1 Tax=Bipolaris victoriae (strain FI3) TaxID=930091 RepID=W7EPE7_BIPV3|nr:hypothetical protein COCVIDRAFT_101953 [Bipolaris victoriae FI3]
METERPGTGPYVALVHGMSKDVYPYTFKTSRCQEAEIGDVEATTRRAILAPTTMEKALRCPGKPQSTADLFTDNYTSGANASHESFDHALRYQVPTYPTIPPLQPLNTRNGTHRACGLGMSRSKRLPRPPSMHFTTVVEHKHPAYAPAQIAKKCSVETFSVFEIDDIAEEKVAITGFLSVPTQGRRSRASSMSSVVSEISHQEPGAIYIRPSAQLQNMQSVSDCDRKLQEAARFYSSAICKPNNLGIHTPTGTPESISNIPFRTSVYQAHAKLNRSLQSIPTLGSCKSIQNWARSSEWVEPCQTAEGPTEWIEDFLTRKEQADRAEEEQTRNEKKEKVTVMRGNSLDKFRRRLSIRRVPEERRNTVPRRRKSDMVSTRDRTRAVSWDIRTHENILGRYDFPSGLSSEHSPSPPPLNSVEKPPTQPAPAPAPQQPPVSHDSIPTIKDPLKENMSQLSLHTPKYACHDRSSSKNSGLPRLKFRSVTMIGADVKKSFCTTVVPVIVEGKNNISELVSKMEKLGQGLTWGKIGKKVRFKRKGKGMKRKDSASTR